MRGGTIDEGSRRKLQKGSVIKVKRRGKPRKGGWRGGSAQQENGGGATVTGEDITLSVVWWRNGDVDLSLREVLWSLKIKTFLNIR